MKVCTPRTLPRSEWVRSVKKAIEINPDNKPPDLDETNLQPPPSDERLSIDVERRWSKKGVKLTVGFLDKPEAALRERILSHLNAWLATANVSFVESKTEPQVRIARFTAEETEPGYDGYWSYLGTDILLFDTGPTMNLEAFTMNTPESEFVRVVRHEAGHTLGFPHEHIRKAIIERLDRKKVIADFKRTQGWTEQEVIDQVLTPLEASSLLGTTVTDETSIMCYQIDGKLTLDGTPIPGGADINALDAAVAAKGYPKPRPKS
jgi:hypothetical protein